MNKVELTIKKIQFNFHNVNVILTKIKHEWRSPPTPLQFLGRPR